MTKYNLFEPTWRNNLLPLTFTRPVANIRVGILTIDQKWEKLFETTAGFITENYLSSKFKPLKSSNIYINGSVCPTQLLANEVLKLTANQLLMYENTIVAFKTLEEITSTDELHKVNFSAFQPINFNSQLTIIKNTWDIFLNTATEIANDINILKPSLKKTIPPNNQIFGHEIYMDEDAKVRGCILNAETGPIYLGKNAEIMEGSVIRGPFALGEGAQVKMAAKIYGPTSIGPYSKVGGELSNVVFQGYSNKGHDGFLGNSVIGEWCNLGADTNSSNLKNNYSTVKIYNYALQQMANTNLQFCGLIMGDHSKTGINTMLNTGTVVGVSANIFGANFPPKFVPSFAWGATTFEVFNFEKACEIAEKVMQRRNVPFTQVDKEILAAVFELEQKHFN